MVAAVTTESKFWLLTLLRLILKGVPFVLLFYLVEEDGLDDMCSYPDDRWCFSIGLFA